AAKRDIERLLERYQESGLLDDRRFGANLLSGLRRRGVSTRAARLKLLTKGVSEDLVAQLLSQEAEEAAGDSEFDAALAYVKKRRLGYYRRATSSADAPTEGEWQEPARLTPKKTDGRDEGEAGAGRAQGKKAFGRGKSGGFGRARNPEAARRDKDLAALARRGFSFDVARRALETPPED
ncbi:MAG: RecX family transcriptional regulator, partial [Polyangiaceae bacterium]